jgi:hypothetical protein
VPPMSTAMRAGPGLAVMNGSRNMECLAWFEARQGSEARGGRQGSGDSVLEVGLVVESYRVHA